MITTERRDAKSHDTRGILLVPLVSFVTGAGAAGSRNDAAESVRGQGDSGERTAEGEGRASTGLGAVPGYAETWTARRARQRSHRALDQLVDRIC